MSEFDPYAKNYKEVVEDSFALGGLEHAFFTRVKVESLKHALEKLGSPLPQLKALDLGCGVGATDAMLEGIFGELHGTDLSEDSLREAQVRNPWVTYRSYTEDGLPYESNSFDVIFTINVMHHVPPDSWKAFVLEAKRVLKKGGCFVVFEHNPKNPLTLKTVKDCPFDANAVLLHRSQLHRLIKACGLSPIRSSYILFFPFKSKLFRKMERLLSWLPLGAQYFHISKCD